MSERATSDPAALVEALRRYKSAGVKGARLSICDRAADAIEALMLAAALRPMEEWAQYEHKDDLVLLLVEFEEYSIDDAVFALTIGGNNDHNVLPGEGDGWHFAGWCWFHDHFTNGVGTPVGWMPLPHHLAREREQARLDALASGQSQ